MQQWHLVMQSELEIHSRPLWFHAARGFQRGSPETSRRHCQAMLRLMTVVFQPVAYHHQNRHKIVLWQYPERRRAFVIQTTVNRSRLRWSMPWWNLSVHTNSLNTNFFRENQLGDGVKLCAFSFRHHHSRLGWKVENLFWKMFYKII